VRAPDHHRLRRVPKLRVLLACTGLGRERRGFEAFTRACATALAGEETLDLRVLAGGYDDQRAGEQVIANLPRNGGAARTLGALLRRDPYYIEQVSFALGMLPTLMRVAPDVVYFADLNLGNALWHWRRMSGAKYKLLFYNGGNSRMPFTRCDHVQQVTPAHLEAAVARGESRDRMTLLPHGVDVARPGVAERLEARAHLQLPLDGEILLSVGLLDRAIKRTDLLVEGLALLPSPRPYLMLAGADGPDGPSLRALAAARLGDRWSWRSVPSLVMPWVYRAADRFALLSRGEGFGLAYAEALAAGLPVLAHDDATTRYVVGAEGILRTITDAESARAGLAELLAAPVLGEAARARHDWVRDRFGWEVLRPRYVELFHAVAAGRP
jgi:1,2-diacylglycerol 3-alpha-glucosyltransferase